MTQRSAAMAFVGLVALASACSLLIPGADSFDGGGGGDADVPDALDGDAAGDGDLDSDVSSDADTGVDADGDADGDADADAHLDGDVSLDGDTDGDADDGECTWGTDGPDCLEPLLPNLPSDRRGWLEESSTEVVLRGRGLIVTSGPQAGLIRHEDGTLREPGEGVISAVRFATLPQGAEEPGIGVFVLGSLTVDVGAHVEVSGNRSLMIVAAGGVLLGGFLDASARLDAPGPGGFGATAGPGAGAIGGRPSGETGVDPGGGGAGHGGTGGGGGGSYGGAGGAGGAENGLPSVVPLVGGSGGGHGLDLGGHGVGGAGGGAVEILSAAEVRVSPTGGVTAAGGGGSADEREGAGGGGSGGAVVLVAPRVTVEGVLAANGGGGGGVGDTSRDGEDGSPSAAVAEGGAGWADCDGGSGGAGGHGGAATLLDGAPGTPCDRAGGGGGGAVGRLRIVDLDGAVPAGGTLSPSCPSAACAIDRVESAH